MKKESLHARAERAIKDISEIVEAAVAAAEKAVDGADSNYYRPCASCGHNGCYHQGQPCSYPSVPRSPSCGCLVFTGRERASELEWLRFFVEHADFGPAHGDVVQGLKDEFMTRTGKNLPAGWNLRGDGETSMDKE